MIADALHPDGDRTAGPAPGRDPDARVTRSLLGHGVLAGPVYVVASLTQALTRDGFDLTRHSWSLLALMEIQASRTAARRGPTGEPFLLADQDPRRWDRLLIRRGPESLRTAESLPGPVGPYPLQASVAARHARAASVEDTDWSRIATLYGLLSHVWPSPVVELNRAVAVGRSAGPAEGLAVLEPITAAGRLADYPQLAAVRGDLLDRLGDQEGARAEFERAAALTRNAQERALFLTRASSLSSAGPGGGADQWPAREPARGPTREPAREPVAEHRPALPLGTSHLGR
jgi:hypothetical protein